MNNLVISKKKRNLIIAISLSLIIMIIGTTYAYFSWQSTNNPLVDITVEDIADVIIKGGNDINITNIGPVLDYNDGEITEFYIKKKIENNLDLTINIIPTLLPDNLKEESFKLKLLSSNDNITYNEISEINFKDKEQDNVYKLSIIDLNQNITYYKIIFYIDGNMYNPNTMKSNNFKAKIDVSVDTKFYIDSSNANAPVLADGMIPVMYDNDTNNWVKADYYNKDSKYAGYDYENKQWANAVMVTSATRDKYMNADTGIIVPENDILAYFVWIPRYKYKLFNVEFNKANYKDNICTSNCPQVIDVIFENGTNTTGETKCQVSEIGVETCTNNINGNYYTHPAFTFGNQELEGIWVSKFIITGSEDNPTIKPNNTPINDGIYVSTKFLVSQKFNSTSYLTSKGINKADSHMMKNIEWGSVAYLKQSNYGLGLTDIGMNYIAYGDITGCGAPAGTNYQRSDTCNEYNTSIGMLASTTGNITGVYDMSGGTQAVVMGVMQDDTTNKRSPLSGYSGFIGKNIRFDGDDFVPEENNSTLPFPDSKYYDLYAYALALSSNDYTRSHLGDATGETAGWYEDWDYFVYSASFGAWFKRGGFIWNSYTSSHTAGIFASITPPGMTASEKIRVVLSVTK